MYTEDHLGKTYPKAEDIYDKAFERYISPSVYEKMNKSGWFFERIGWAGMKKIGDIRTIQEYLDSKTPVKCCYMATSVRGYHNHYIISKEN